MLYGVYFSQSAVHMQHFCIGTHKSRDPNDVYSTSLGKSSPMATQDKVIKKNKIKSQMESVYNLIFTSMTNKWIFFYSDGGCWHRLLICEDRQINNN